MSTDRSTVYFIPTDIPLELQAKMERRILRGSAPGWTYTVSKFDPCQDEILQGCTYIAETSTANYYWNEKRQVWVDDSGDRI